MFFSPPNGGIQYSAIRQGTAGIAPFFSSSVLLQPAVRRTGPLAIFFCLYGAADIFYGFYSEFPALWSSRPTRARAGKSTGSAPDRVSAGSSGAACTVVLQTLALPLPRAAAARRSG